MSHNSRNIEVGEMSNIATTILIVVARHSFKLPRASHGTVKVGVDVQFCDGHGDGKALKYFLRFTFTRFWKAAFLSSVCSELLLGGKGGGIGASVLRSDDRRMGGRNGWPN
jgi:hypothetical protein